VLSLISTINRDRARWSVLGLADDAPSPINLERTQRLGGAVLGSVSDLCASPPAWFVVAIADPRHRRTAAEKLESAGWQPATLIHPSVTMDPGTTIGDGSIICAGARLTTGTELGRHVQVDQNATIGHDCRLGNYARLNPSACVSGWVDVGADALIGANATVLQGLSVGAAAVVGAGAVVVKDVPPSTTVKGVPAR
jgi:sugar O-acyltransferase (sialic acid O-acetyltransferase NeuD family)